jgi:hypothetical protein
MKPFHKIKMEGSYWGVFIVNPNDNTDRYLVSSTFDKEHETETLAADLNRIAEGAAKFDAARPILTVEWKKKRSISFED